MLVRGGVWLGAGPSGGQELGSVGPGSVLWWAGSVLGPTRQDDPGEGRNQPRVEPSGCRGEGSTGGWRSPPPWTLTSLLRSFSFPGWWRARWGTPWDLPLKPERTPTPKPFWPVQRRRKKTRKQGPRQGLTAGRGPPGVCAQYGQRQRASPGPGLGILGVPTSLASWSL